MFCHSCGTEVLAAWAFCGHCGSRTQLGPPEVVDAKSEPAPVLSSVVDAKSDHTLPIVLTSEGARSLKALKKRFTSKPQGEIIPMRFTVKVGDTITRIGWSDEMRKAQLETTSLENHISNKLDCSFKLLSYAANGSLQDYCLKDMLADKKLRKRRGGRVIVSVPCYINKKHLTSLLKDEVFHLNNNPISNQSLPLVQTGVKKRVKVETVSKAPSDAEVISDTDEEMPTFDVKQRKRVPPITSTGDKGPTTPASASPSPPLATLESAASICEQDDAVKANDFVNQDDSVMEQALSKSKTTCQREDEEAGAMVFQLQDDDPLDDWRQLMAKKEMRHKMANERHINIVSRAACTLIYKAHGGYSICACVDKEETPKVLYDLVCRHIEPEVAPTCFILQTLDGEKICIDSKKQVGDLPDLLYIVEEDYNMNETITNYDDVLFKDRLAGSPSTSHWSEQSNTNA